MNNNYYKNEIKIYKQYIKRMFHVLLINQIIIYLLNLLHEMSVNINYAFYQLHESLGTY